MLFLSVCLSQKKGDNEIWLEGRFKAGFLAAHRSLMGHVAVEHAYAGEISYLVQSKGRKMWHNHYRMPTLGITGFFGTAGNRELLGHYVGAYSFINLPIIKHKSYTFSFKTGAGLGYGAKVYDPEDNILSIALSSKVNALLVLAFESRIHKGNHSATLSLDMTHLSNGAIKIPNLGLNLPYVSAGYGYRIQESTYCDTHAAAGLRYKSFEYGIVGYGSAQEVFPTGGDKLGVVGVNFVGRKYFSRKYGMEVSFDVMSKQSIIALNPGIATAQSEIIQMGIFTGYLLPMGRFHMVIGMGIYVRDKFKPVDFLYHRVGMRYVFNNGLNINLVLKSHWARADYIEYGIGYTLAR